MSIRLGLLGAPLAVLTSACAPVDPAACPRGQTLEVVPPERVIRAIAHDERGNELLVTVAKWELGNARRAPKLFFGPAEHVLQRRVDGYGVQKDGGTTTIHFDLDSEQAVLTFPTRLTKRTPRPPTLQVGDTVFGVSEPTKAPSDMAGKTYVCAGHIPPPER